MIQKIYRSNYKGKNIHITNLLKVRYSRSSQRELIYSMNNGSNHNNRIAGYLKIAGNLITTMRNGKRIIQLRIFKKMQLLR